MKIQTLVFAGYAAAFTSVLRAGCCEPETPAETHQAAQSIGDYRVVSSRPFLAPSGKICTRHDVRLNESLKGDPPARIEFVTPGGRLGNQIEVSSLGLELQEGADYIFHLSKNTDGTWQPLPFRTHANHGPANQKKSLRDFIRGGAKGRMPRTPGTEQVQGNSGVPGSRLTATGYFEKNTVPYRHITCDSGNPILCVVDMDPTKLPAGTDAAAALVMVQDALDAWSEVSSLKFKIEGTTSLGAAASTILSTDGKLRIQLHDNHGAISNNTILGIGGSTISLPTPTYDHYNIAGSGGTIAGRTFLRFPQGHVVLNHRAPSMADAVNFAEVLTHEIGHALGLVHSSESPSETEPMLRDATMYYMSHQDGRGADIREYDENRVRFGYPLNTPPYSLNRFLRAVVASTGNPKPANAAPMGTGVDRITVNGGDLQGTPVTVSLLPATDPAIFSLSGNTISFTSPANRSDILNLEPEAVAAGEYYHQALFTLSDGVNVSAIHSFNITGFHRDSSPADGLPNSWLQTYFGLQTVGAAGSAHHPLSDPDKDGLDNRTERYLGTSPIDPKSGPARMTFNPQTRTLDFDPVRFAPYVIEATSNFAAWSPRTAVTTLSAPAPITIPVSGDAGQSRMFYRARLVP